MRRVRIGTYQLPAMVAGTTGCDRKAVQVERLVMALDEVGRVGVDLACVGETCTTSHLEASPDDRTIFEDAVDGPTTRHVAEIAEAYRMNVALPIAASWRGALRNLVVVIDRQGQVVGVYAKVHPTRSERSRGVVPGDDFPVFRLDFGVVGALICHDLSFVESARILALRGAEVLIWPTWWSGWG
jgi:predicted amidohydrolase